MNQKTVRTRFAPSPTGYMHIGNLRTALYAYLLAKKNNGKFILRIEDTDKERYVEGSISVIYKTLHETGLIYDEGPDIGGDFGPYIQSERKNVYMDFAKKLIENKNAYYCFCQKNQDDDLSENKFGKYDGKCRNLSDDEIEKKLKDGASYVIRQKIPNSGTTSFTDAVFGEITVDNNELDDGVLIKSDGLPTYNFANVIDDHLMQITHIIRGSEYLSSTPKYNLLYNALGFEIPTYIHCSPVMKNATQKLSKRNGDASYEDLINKGYLKEAIINYIALLGWSPQNEREIYSLGELIEAFDVNGISKSPAIFDILKLDWINGEYIKNMPADDFYKIALPYIENTLNFKTDFYKISQLLSTRISKLSQIPELILFLNELDSYSTELYNHKKMKTDPQVALSSLLKVLPVLENISDFSEENLHNVIFDLIEKLEIKTGQMLWPIRVALSGKDSTPGGAIELLYLLGKENSIKRIKYSIELLKN